MNDPAAEVALAKALYYRPDYVRTLIERGFNPAWVANPLVRAFLAGAVRLYLEEGVLPTPENAVSRAGLGPEATAELLRVIHAIAPAPPASPDGVAANVERLAALAEARKLRAALEALSRELAARPLEVRRIASEAAQAAFNLLRGRQAAPVTPRELLGEAVRSKPAPFSTGLPTLDRALAGGVHPGHTVAVAAPPGRGKTSLACFVSAQALAQGVPVVYVSVEMSRTAILERVLSVLSRSPSPIREFQEADPAVTAWVDRIDPILRVVDTAQDAAEIGALMRLYAAEFGDRPGLFVVDHLHRVGPGRTVPADRPELLYGELARRLIDQARELGWALWLVGQVSVATEREWVATGTITALHFKWSGDVVAHADFAMFLGWHPKVTRRSVLLLYKDRLEGKQMRMEFDYDPTTRTFSEVTNE